MGMYVQAKENIKISKSIKKLGNRHKHLTKEYRMFNSVIINI